MITLYGFGENFSVQDPSPFVLKVDAYLRMAGIEFNTIAKMNNLQKAPKAKLPFITDGDKSIADSQFIIAYLKKAYGDTLDEWLSEEQKALSYLITKSLDENFYWTIVHSRWICEKTWPLTKKAFFGNMPFPVKLFVPKIVRKDIRSTLHKQGIGRHTEQEIHHIAKQTFESLSVLIGDKPYVMGDNICSLDATVFAFLAECILADIDNDINTMARSYPNLVDYCNRINQAYY